MRINTKVLNDQYKNEPAQTVIGDFLNVFDGKIALASSFGAEDQILTDMIATHDGTARIFTLDTGRLPEETYALMDQTNRKYGISITLYFPESFAVETLCASQGMYGFRESVENRKECCRIRKIAPLRRALEGLDVWITGLRRCQSPTRETMEMVEWDEANGLIKLNPLIEWSDEEVWEYIHARNVPYNALHDQGYPSIGCAPCTRAIREGEDIRAGRWWWEHPEHKECGLHLKGVR